MKFYYLWGLTALIVFIALYVSIILGNKFLYQPLFQVDKNESNHFYKDARTGK